MSVLLEFLAAIVAIIMVCIALGIGFAAIIFITDWVMTQIDNK